MKNTKNYVSLEAVHTHTHTHTHKISLGKNIEIKNALNKNKKYIK